MSKVGDALRRLVANKNPTGAGTVLIKPSEATVKNISAITNSGATATVVSGSVTNPTTISYISSGRGGSGTSSYVATTNPSQAQYQQEVNRQREVEVQRQNDLNRIASEKKRQQEIQRQAAQRSVENKRLQTLAVRANIEKSSAQQRNTTLQEQLRIVQDKAFKDRAGVYIPPTDKFGKSEEYYIKEKSEAELQSFADSIFNEVNAQVQSGNMNVSTANDVLARQIDLKYDSIVRDLEKKYPPATVNYKLEKMGINAKKEKFIDKAISKLTVVSGKRTEKATTKGQELIQNRADLEKLLGLAKNNNISNADLKKIKPLSRRRIELTLASFGTKSISRVTDTALGLALLTKVPGLLKTQEGRRIIAAEVMKLPDTVIQDLKKFGALYRTNPEQAAAIVATDYLVMRGVGAGIKGLGKISKTTINKLKALTTKTISINAGKFTLRQVEEQFQRRGRDVFLSKRNVKTGRFVKFQKEPPIKIKVGSIADIKESLAQQLAREGQSLVAVTAQANDLIRGIRNRAVIRKPFKFNEKKLSSTTRELLKKFDKGKLNPREIIVLNQRLRAETKRIGIQGQTKGIDLLERSLYFDPDRTLRKSRLALEETTPGEANLFDLLSGRASIFNKSARPAIYVIEEFAEKLPRTKEFASIIKKLKNSVIAGRDPNLTRAELARLTRWQVTPSGKLKTIGSTTYQGGLEREVTGSPGDIIKKIKKLGTLKIGNKMIPIYAIKMIQGKNKVGIIKRITRMNESISALRRRKSGLKSNKARSNIERKISAKTRELEKVKSKTASKEVRDFLRDSRRRTPKRKKYYPIKRKFASRAIPRLNRRGVRKAPRTFRVTSRKGVTRPGRLSPRGTTAPRSMTPTRPAPRRVTGRVGARGSVPRKPITGRPTGGRGGVSRSKARAGLRRSSNKRSRRNNGIIRGYNVFVKSKGKFIKANRLPLSKFKAQDRASYIVDNSISATAKLIPVRYVKRLGSISSREVGARSIIKARTYRIVRGRKVPMLNTIIENRGKPRINRRGEIRGLTAARLIKQLNRSPGTSRPMRRVSRVMSRRPIQRARPTRRVSPSQRRVLLQRLEKARAVRMRNLNRRRR